MPLLCLSVAKVNLNTSSFPWICSGWLSGLQWVCIRVSGGDLLASACLREGLLSSLYVHTHDFLCLRTYVWDLLCLNVYESVVCSLWMAGVFIRKRKSRVIWQELAVHLEGHGRKWIFVFKGSHFCTFFHSITFSFILILSIFFKEIIVSRPLPGDSTFQPYNTLFFLY